MVLMPIVCPYCQGDRVVKRGRTDTRKQRYRCQNPDCSRASFLLDPAYKGRLPDITDRCILSLIFLCANLRTWTDDMDFPKPGKRPGASGRLNSSNMGGNSTRLPKRWGCPQRRSASGWRKRVSTAWRGGGPSRGPQAR